MNKFYFLIINVVLFTVSINAQEISSDTKEAIISAIEFSNDVSKKFDLRHTYPSKNTVKIFCSMFNDKVASDSIIDELNRNKCGIVFYNSHKAFHKKNKKIDSSWLVVNYHKADSNMVEIYLSDCWYKDKTVIVNPDIISIICKKSVTPGKWHIAHEFFIQTMSLNFSETDYSVLTQQLYNNLQKGQLETENDYMLLFNYLRKKDDSEYYVKIKELLCSIIEKNPEVAERVENYFFLFSKFRFIDESTSVIEENYKKITGNDT